MVGNNGRSCPFIRVSCEIDFTPAIKVYKRWSSVLELHRDRAGWSVLGSLSYRQRRGSAAVRSRRDDVGGVSYQSRHPQRWLCPLSFIRGAEGPRQDVARRPTISILYHHPSPRHHTPALSASDLECSPLAPTGHLRQKLRLNDMTPQLKIPIPDLRLAASRRSLMDPPSESHSVEIATTPPPSTPMEKISFLLQLKW